MKKATTRKSGSKLWENISKLCEVLDGALHKIFWEGNLFSKILYILFPFFLILGFGLVLFRNDAFLMENSGYGFLDDYANCYMLMYIFFFMYFAHGLYLPWLDKTVDEFGKKYASKKYIDYKNKKAIRTIKSVILVVSLVLSILAFQFIGTALDYGNLNWYSKLNVLELAY